MIRPDVLPECCVPMKSIDRKPADEAARFRYSLIIATLHDEGDLEKCLTSLCAIESSLPFEVIAVD